MFKRVISLLLCLALMAPMVPIPTRATEPTTPETVETFPTESTPETTAPTGETTAPTAPTETIPPESATAQPAAATSASGKCGKYVTWTLGNGTLTIAGAGAMDEYTNDLSIPWDAYRAEVTNLVIKKGVSTISGNAFSGFENITSVTIPEGVTSIGSEAFEGCTSLTSAQLPDSLTSIGYRCFYECGALTDVNLPSRLTEIGSGAFYYTDLTGSLTIPEGVTVIEDSTFQGCKNLTAVTLPEGITSIGFQAFIGCERLSSINFPQSLTTIETAAFSGTALTEVTLPEGIISIGADNVGHHAVNYAGVFSHCTNLVSISLPDSLEVIGDNAFSGCSSLRSITLPPKLTSIHESVFWGCAGLTEIVIPEGVTHIEDSAFNSCTNLYAVTIPASVTTIGESAFQSCPLREIYYTGTEDQWAALVDANKNYHINGFPDGLQHLWDANIHCNWGKPQGICGENLTWTYENGTLTISGSGDMAYYDSPQAFPWHQYRAEITALSLPEGLTSISYDAFFSCTQLTSVTLPSTLTTIGGNAFSFSGLTGTIAIPANVTNIGTGAFQSCNSLTGFAVAEANPRYRAIDGVLFSKDGTTLHTYPAGAPAANYSAPAGTTTLETGSFMGCHNLTGVSLPEGLTTIYGSSFYCDNLTGILLPASLSYVGHYAFLTVPVLSTVFYTGTQEQWQYLAENGVMDGNQSLLATMVHYNWTRPETPEVPEAPLGGTCGQNLTWRLENGTLTISGTGPMEGYPWRQYASQITAISIGYGVTSISYDAFANLNGITEVVIPETVIAIGAQAFQGLQGLTRVEIQGPTLLESCTFDSCSQLKTLVLPKACTLISTGAFAYCSSLTDVYFTGTEAEWSDFLQNKVETGNDALKNAPNVVCNYGAVVEPTEPTIPTEPSEPTAPTEPEEEELLSQGTCGDSAAWTLTTSGRLTISGTGAVTSAPWREGHAAQITAVTVSDGITALCDAAFLDCVNLKKVTLPASVTTIGASAFYGCTALTSAGPLDSGADYEFAWTKEIPANAFLYLKSLTKITLPKGLTTIGEAAFRESGVTKLVIPEGVTKIGNNAFMSCTGLKRLSLPSTLTTTGSYAFANCTSLADVFVMGKKTAFGSGTFQYCSAITNVFYALSEEKVDSITGGQILQNAANIFYDWDDPMETHVMILRHAKWHDAVREQLNLSDNSYESIDIRIIPGLDDRYNSAAYFSILQNDRTLLRNYTGQFEDMVLQQYFVKNGIVKAKITDSRGTILYEQQLNLRIREGYTVTYVFWDNRDAYGNITSQNTLSETYDSAYNIASPEELHREGYFFAGWYASPDCTGVEFFSEKNYYNRILLEEDITLYAKWIKDDGSILTWEDVWSFVNSSDEFRSEKYEISGRDQLALFLGLSAVESALVLDHMLDEWGGSCFGMSSTVVLAKSGDFDIDLFDPSCNTISSASLFYNSTPAEVGNVESAINFYQVRQEIGAIRIARLQGEFSKESTNLQRIVKKMQSVNTPVVLILESEDDDDFCHAVVAFGLEKTITGYQFFVYDCSKPQQFYPVTITDHNGTFSESCPEWEQRWGGIDIFFQACMTAKELKAEKILVKPGLASKVSSTDIDDQAEDYLLKTTYNAFTLTSQAGTAVISGGKKVSGDLEILCCGNISEPGYTPRFQFYLPVLSETDAYTIIPSGTEAGTIILYYDHTEDGFFIKEESAQPGELRFSADGSVSTSYPQETAHTLHVTINGTATPWHGVEIQGESTGFHMTPGVDSTAIRSESETTVTVKTNNTFNSTTLSEVSLTSDPVLVEEGENNTCIITQNGAPIASSDYGFAVLFNSNLGTNVESLQNVPTGTLIPAPVDPTKTGYLFEGWFTDEAYTDRWDFATDTVTADLVLYAGWSVDPDYMKSLTFRVPGQPDQIVYLPVGSPIPADYAPLGPDGEALSWFTDSACTEPWDFETGTLTRNLILYGETALCTVTFVTGIAEALDAVPLRSGMTIPQPVLTREGHTLCGWYTDEACTTLWDFEADTVSANMTLYARWLENEVDKNGQDTGIAIEILNPEAIVYTGKPLKPQIVVRDGGKILVEGRDFTLAYRNNTNAADICDDRIKSNKLPQVTIQGKGNYRSTKKITKYFTILPADLADLDITLPAQIATKSGNKHQTLKATVSTGLVKAPASAYSLRYFTDPDLTQEVTGITVPGLYYVTLQAKTGGNYTGTSDSFPVEAAPSAKLVSSAKITLGKNLTALDTQPEESAAIALLLPKVVLDKTTFLTDPENIGAFLAHFVVTATDADGTSLSQTELGKLLTGPGKKTLHLAAKPGNEAGFVGTKDISIQIKGPALNKKQFLVTFDRNAKNPLLKTDFTGFSQIPAVISDLVEGTDYMVSYKQGKNAISADQIVNAGTYTLVITGKNGYSGTLSYNFSINKADLAKLYAAGRLRIVSTGSAVYDPNGAFPHYSLSFAAEGGRISLENGVDYTLTYSGNKTVTEKASATIRGKGNFTGSLPAAKAQELRFSVTPKPITASDISVSVTGITIQKNVVKSVKFALSHNGKNIAAAQYKGTFTDNGETLTLTVTAAGKLYTGTRTVALRKDLIKATDGKQVKISLPKDVKYYYTGREILPDVTITDGNGQDISHCFVISCTKNQDVGTASVTVTGRPDMGYCGSKTVKFTILPRWLQWLLG